jgi:hypothetical protein
VKQALRNVGGRRWCRIVHSGGLNLQTTLPNHLLETAYVIRVPGYRSRGPGFDPRRFQIFWEGVGLERGPLSLMRITEELLGGNSSGSGSLNPRIRPWGSLALTTQKLALTSPTCGGRSVDIVRLRTKTTKKTNYLLEHGCAYSNFP